MTEKIRKTDYFFFFSAVSLAVVAALQLTALDSAPLQRSYLPFSHQLKNGFSVIGICLVLLVRGFAFLVQGGAGILHRFVLALLAKSN